ncbi:hypothetical protein ACI3PL_24770, partial [Lacticaseibacillus paracasei]
MQKFGGLFGGTSNQIGDVRYDKGLDAWQIYEGGKWVPVSQVYSDIYPELIAALKKAGATTQDDFDAVVYRVQTEAAAASV